MHAAGITNIRHTTLTAKDVEVQWEQYKKFLDAKKSILPYWRNSNLKTGMLAAEIEHSRLRGITPEQFKEIESNFQMFDKVVFTSLLDNSF